jgi:hypothetical protein
MRLLLARWLRSMADRLDPSDLHTYRPWSPAELDDQGWHREPGGGWVLSSTSQVTIYPGGGDRLLEIDSFGQPSGLRTARDG